MAISNHLKEIRKLELAVSKNLFLVCAGVTLIVMLMVTVEFITRGAFPSSKIHLFYLGVLIIYSFHKELIRWLGEKKSERQGEFFVYSWIGLVTLFYFLDFLSKGFFSHSSLGEPLTTLRDVSILTLEVLVVFFFTRSLKMLKIFLKK